VKAKKKKKKIKSYLFILVVLSLLPFSARAFKPPNSLFGKVVNKVETERKAVALTFDDGPNRLYTPQILEVLAKKDVKATFFVNGLNISGNEGLVRKMVKEGHMIGNHSYSHKNLTLVTSETVREELERNEDLIEKVAGMSFKLFRAPYGYYNSLFLMKYLADNGYVIIGWSVDPQDWKNQSVSFIVADVLENTSSGAIILLHDGPENFGKDNLGVGRQGTVEAVGVIIDKLRERGFEFLTLPELLELDKGGGERVLGEEDGR